MSSAGLAVRAVLTMDNKGLVGAAEEGVVSLDALKNTAKQTGAAGVEMGGGLETATVALDGLTHSSVLAAGVTQASGAARQQEVDSLVRMASASTAASRTVETMSAAQNAYRATVAQAGNALRAGTITQQDFTTVVAGATAKLALTRAGLNEFGKGAEEAEAHTEHLTHEVSHLGREMGVSREQVGLLRGSFGAFDELVELVGGVGIAALAMSAALAAAMVVEQNLANKTSELYDAIDANNLVGKTAAQYRDLAHQIEETADVTQSSALEMATALARARIDPSYWKDYADAAKRYAIATGTTVADALQHLAAAAKDPAAMLSELQAGWEILTTDQQAQVRSLIDAGDKQRAADIIMKGVNETLRITTERLGPVDTLLKTVGKAWDGLGTAVVNAESKMSPEVLALPTLFTGGVALYLAKVGELKKAFAQTHASVGSMAADAKAHAQADLDWFKSVGDELDPFAARLAKNAAEADKTRALQTKGIITQAQATDRLNLLDKQRTQIIAEQAKQQQFLTEGDKKAASTREAQHKSIVDQIADLGKSVAAQHLEADTAVQAANAVGLSAQARKKLSDQLEVEKGLLVFTALKNKAEEDGFKDLIPLIERAAAEYKQYAEQKNAANEKAAAIDDVKSQYAQLSGQFADVALQLREATQAAQDWMTGTIASLGGVSKITDQEMAKIKAIFASDMDKALDDSLAHARDWASGVKSALHGLDDDLDNFAKRSAEATKSLSDEFEQAFVDGVSGSENVLQDFLTFFLKLLAKMIYETYAAKMMNGLAGDIVSAIGSAFGMSDGIEPVTVTPQVQVGVGHQGLVAGGAAVDSRTVSASTFSGAPRFHTGISRIKGLQPGEVPAILKEGERVYTEQQANAVDDALERPIVVRLPESMFARNQVSADATREQVSQTAIRESASVIDFLKHTTSREETVHREITSRGTSTAAPIGAAGTPSPVIYQPMTIGALHTQPLAIHLPDHVGGGSAAGYEPMKVQVTVHNLDGQTSRAKTSPNGNGGLNIDVIVDQIESRMSQRVMQGNGTFGRTLQQTFDLKRKVS